MGATSAKPSSFTTSNANPHAGETLLPAEITASGAELVAFNPIGADLESVFLEMVEVAA